jgi:peptidoglycan hydrolase-like protein with peptidoglycan-binding domain
VPGIARRRPVFEGRALTGLVLGAVLALVLAGCTSDGGGTGNGALKVAQARVSAKEKALTAAKAEFTSASAAFCGDSSTYITALDRYGDVLHQTAPTVGDVTTAGADLAAPREDVVAAAEAAVAAQQAVADAEQELAAAEAALAAAKNPSASATSSAKATTSPKPLVPAATANRVKEAEAQFATAQQGITDETPLAQASEQFNAAVVALEMSWLQLFADAGCLTDDQQVQAEVAVRDYTTALQKSLKEAGYYTSEVDGVYGPDTVDAVETVQKTHSLPVTGTVDKATAAALQADLAEKGGAVAQEAVASTSAVQQTLKLAGYWDGPVDGVWTPALTEALKEFQTALGVKPSGEVDAATVAALEKALEELGQPSASASASPSASGGSPTGESATDSSTP